ncbi:hypothetical protein ACFYSC_22490 [Streptosporangium sp. NPDC004379]|uniref:hypothetical protein n=1 Tax=Streptosporangium sp. NPDC004379 TaxID=3366189 RepID=UPI00369336F8
MTTIKHALSAGAMFASLLAVPAVAPGALGGLPGPAGLLSTVTSQFKAAKPCPRARNSGRCRARRRAEGPARTGPVIALGRPVRAVSYRPS